MIQIVLLACVSASPACPVSAIACDALVRQDLSPRVAKKGEPTYPSFEPFRASRMFPVFFPDIEHLDLAKTLEEVRTMADIQKFAKAAGEEVSGGPPTGASALLTPSIDEPARSAFVLAPVVFMKLEPLWKAGTWSADQVALARAGVGILSGLPDLPKVEFQEGRNAENRAALKDLVRWFGVQVSKPERLAAMIPTLDDGPFAGLPYETKDLLAASASQKLSKDLEIRLGRVDRPKEPWVLQGARAGKLLWSRVVSGGPDESVTDAELIGKPLAIGTYGWKVHLRVHWSQGDEQGIVYVDPQGKLLFYYLSW